MDPHASVLARRFNAEVQDESPMKISCLAKWDESALGSYYSWWDRADHSGFQAIYGVRHFGQNAAEKCRFARYCDAIFRYSNYPSPVSWTLQLDRIRSNGSNRFRLGALENGLLGPANLVCGWVLLGPKWKPAGNKSWIRSSWWDRWRQMTTLVNVDFVLRGTCSRFQRLKAPHFGS